MKHKFLKLIQLLFTVLLSLGVFTGPVMMNVSAEGYTLNVETPYGSQISADGKWAIGTNNAFGSDIYSRLSINGQKVYCVQQTSASVQGAGDYTTDILNTYIGNDTLATQLEYISALGYGYNQDYSEEMDFATQIRIWQAMGQATVTNIHPDIQAKIDQINDRLAIMNTPVSFNQQQVVLNGYGKEYAVTLQDSTGNFQYYLERFTEGVHTERNGNSLTIWAEPGDASQTQLAYDCLYLGPRTGTSIIYKSASSQDVGFLLGANPTEVLLNVSVLTGSIQVSKRDFKQEDEAQDLSRFQNAIFDVIDDSTQQSVGQLTADGQGNSGILEGLSLNHTYTIQEIQAPAGYVRAAPVKVTIQNADLQIIEIKDKQVTVLKQDQLDNTVNGATLQVLNSNGDILDEWISGEEHAISGLSVNETYTLHEKEAPEGYLKADDIEFSVNDDQSDQILIMKDTKTDSVSVTKYDLTNKKELAGAKLKVVDKDNKVIDEWTSTDKEHIIHNLVVNESYTLIEESAPKGYRIAEKIEFKVEDNGAKVQEVKMYDQKMPTVPTGLKTNTFLYFISMAAVLSIGLVVKMKLNRNKS